MRHVCAGPCYVYLSCLPLSSGSRIEAQSAALSPMQSKIWNRSATSWKLPLPDSRKFVLEQVKVDTSTVATANIRLEPGNVSTQITVEATVPLVNSESGTLATTITQRLLTDVPLANRSVLDLAVSVPNVTGDVGTEDPQVTSQTPVPGYNLNINGGRFGICATRR